MGDEYDEAMHLAGMPRNIALPPKANEWAKALASNRTKLTKWSFETFWKGDTHQSPRRFDTMEECIVAITTKLTQHALDHEFPMIKISMVEGDK